MVMSKLLEDDPLMNNDLSSQYNKVIELAQLTLKVVILINGAAAIALLTFIGSMLSSGIGFDAVPCLLAWAIGSFGFGVLTGAIAVGMGYRSEYFHFHQNRYFIRLTSDEEIVADMREKIMKQYEELFDLSDRHLNYARRLVYACFALFGIGIVFCTLAFVV